MNELNKQWIYRMVKIIAIEQNFKKEEGKEKKKKKLMSALETSEITLHALTFKVQSSQKTK